ncbi:hypothetical protein PROFUN_17112, partial [Planoprotostelium fungivorum]
MSEKVGTHSLPNGTQTSDGKYKASGGGWMAIGSGFSVSPKYLGKNPNSEYLSILRMGYSNTHDSSHCTCDETASHLREEGASEQEPNNKMNNIASTKVDCADYRAQTEHRRQDVVYGHHIRTKQFNESL